MLAFLFHCQNTVAEPTIPILGSLDSGHGPWGIIGSGYDILGAIAVLFILIWLLSPMIYVTFKELKRKSLFDAIREGLRALFPNRVDVEYEGDGLVKHTKV